MTFLFLDCFWNFTDQNVQILVKNYFQLEKNDKKDVRFKKSYKLSGKKIIIKTKQCIVDHSYCYSANQRIDSKWKKIFKNNLLTEKMFRLVLIKVITFLKTSSVQIG